jgi:hypothetical protein
VIRNKNIKLIINYGLGPVLLLFIVYDLWKQLSRQEELFNSHSKWVEAILQNGIGLFLMAFLLMFFQWIIEAIKWKILIKPLVDVSLLPSIKMIFSGLSFSMVTPNRLGEFIGRVMHLPSEKRATASILTFYGSFLQFVVYCLLGTVSLFLLAAYHPLVKMPELLHKAISLLKIISPFISFGGLIILLKFSFFSRFIFLLPFLKKFLPATNELNSIRFSQCIYLIMLTVLRCIVFIFQYWLVFKWLGVGLAWTEVFIGVTIMVYWLAILPTISFLEVGLRWEFSILLFAVFTTNMLGVTIGTTIIWLMNIIFPAIIGSVWITLKPKGIQ